MNAKVFGVVAACVWLMSTAACQRRASTYQIGNAKASAAGVTFYNPGPTRPAPTVQLEPADLTTSVGQAGLQVRISNLGAPVGSDMLDQVARAVSLRTWPDLQRIPSVSRIVDATGKSDDDAYAHVYVAAASPMADRWYALAIDALPNGLAWATTRTTIALGSGGQAARFRVGSGAIVSSVRVYSKVPGKQTVFVDFSEPVSAQASVVALSYAEGTVPACQRDTDTVPTVSSPMAQNTTGVTLPQNAPVEAGVTGIRLGCTGSLDLQQTLQLDVRLGVTATARAADTGAMALQVVIRPNAWSDLEDGGKFYKTAM